MSTRTSPLPGPSALIEVTAKGTGALSDLAMGDGDRRVLRVSRIETSGPEYTWPATLKVDRLHVQKSRVRIERQADGTVPLRTLFTLARAPVETERSAPAQGAAAPPTISVTVREALLEDGEARIVDATVTPAARIDVSGSGSSRRALPGLPNPHVDRLAAGHTGWRNRDCSRRARHRRRGPGRESRPERRRRLAGPALPARAGADHRKVQRRSPGQGTPGSALDRRPGHRLARRPRPH